MKTLLFVLILVAANITVLGQTSVDRDAIKRTALNYAEGWYEGNADKMELALSPELAKRIVKTNSQGKDSVDSMTAMTLVQKTRRGIGKQTPKAEQQKDVTILDVIGNAATVKLEMREWVDYLQIGKLNGNWLIINVLWEMKPQK